MVFWAPVPNINEGRILANQTTRVVRMVFARYLCMCEVYKNRQRFRGRGMYLIIPCLDE